MTPHKAQRTWHSLSSKWLIPNPYGGSPLRGGYNRRRKKPSNKRKIKKGILTNLIPVEVVNAITGEVSKGYMRDLSTTKLRQWLSFHNQKAQVEQLILSEKVTLAHLDEDEIKDFPVLIKLGRYQVPYLIDKYRFSTILIRGKKTVLLDLKIVDNLKYFEIIAERKAFIMKLFTKLKSKAKKK